jgi:hypothetical protein
VLCSENGRLKNQLNSGLNWQNSWLRNTMLRMDIQSWNFQRLNPTPSGWQIDTFLSSSHPLTRRKDLPGSGQYASLHEMPRENISGRKLGTTARTMMCHASECTIHSELIWVQTRCL